jgi:hypothetical protein
MLHFTAEPVTGQTVTNLPSASYSTRGAVSPAISSFVICFCCEHTPYLSGSKEALRGAGALRHSRSLKRRRSLKLSGSSKGDSWGFACIHFGIRLLFGILLSVSSLLAYLLDHKGCQHTSAYVNIRPHTSAYASIRQHTLVYWHTCWTTEAARRIRSTP